MFRPIDNPPNPYESAYCEWLEAPPDQPVRLFEDHSRSILSRNESPDIAFRWSANPYRGCQHACAYCYARVSHEYLGWGAGTDFDSQLLVKRSAPDLLRQALSRPRWKRELIAFSGVTDCYQPIEASLALTRRCLRVCSEFRNPVSIVTKSRLVVRDADVLQELAQRASAHVYLSIAFADEDVSRRIDRGAPRPAQRFAAMQALADAGIPVGILVSPVIPGLNDSDIPELLNRAADCGASTAGLSLLRLSGSVQDVFFSRLTEALPLRVKRVENGIRATRAGKIDDSRFGHRMRGSGSRWDAIRDLFQIHASRLGLIESRGGDGRSAERGSADRAGSTTRSSRPARQQLLPFASPGSPASTRSSRPISRD